MTILKTKQQAYKSYMASRVTQDMPAGLAICPGPSCSHTSLLVPHLSLFLPWLNPLFCSPGTASSLLKGKKSNTTGESFTISGQAEWHPQRTTAQPQCHHLPSLCHIASGRGDHMLRSPSRQRGGLTSPVLQGTLASVPPGLPPGALQQGTHTSVSTGSMLTERIHLTGAWMSALPWAAGCSQHHEGGDTGKDPFSGSLY